ncbi:helix-turn-helix domain-containing protein [Streptomyces showdoensis]|uniref:helix-turn-helix domain-containing protein n=1 Tax=Streptomyces showdoensis TaxID=68268 RepID=UPI001F0B4AE5|nr:helix-turn-helix domain-containing protein [Streptomyces showdoensis]
MTQQERHRIAAGLAGGLSYAEIARRLGRPTSTISREVTRNGGPGRYRPQQAHQVTAQRARRSTPTPPPARAVEASGTVADRSSGSAVEAEIVELAVRSGMPRMTARVHVDLLMSEDGRRTAAELTRRLRVSPASVSVSVNFLVENGYVRRERDPQRRRDVYVVDDDAWYHSILISARQTLDVARASIAAAERLGPDRPAARRLARGGTYLQQVVQEMMESADRWRTLLS